MLSFPFNYDVPMNAPMSTIFLPLLAKLEVVVTQARFYYNVLCLIPTHQSLAACTCTVLAVSALSALSV